MSDIDTILSNTPTGLGLKKTYAKQRLELFFKGQVKVLLNKYFLACIDSDNPHSFYVIGFLKGVTKRDSTLEKGIIKSKLECLKCCINPPSKYKYRRIYLESNV